MTTTRCVKKYFGSHVIHGTDENQSLDLFDENNDKTLTGTPDMQQQYSTLTNIYKINV